MNRSWRTRPVLQTIRGLRLAAAVAAGLTGAALGTVPDRAGADEAILRPYANGSGPTAIFRYGRNAENTGDVFGVVDPVLWRIQFFAIEDWTPGGKPLEERRRTIGDCRLPPTFRVWRIHSFNDRIVLQSQPEVTEDALNHGKPFRHTKLVLPITRRAINEIVARPPTAFDDAPRVNCGGVTSFDRPLPAFVPEADTAVAVSGGGNKPFELARRRLSARAPAFWHRKIVLARPGSFLVSAQELEPAGRRGSFRHFIVTSRGTGNGDSEPGFVTSVVTIIRRARSPAGDRAMRLNLGLARVKTGQRLAAVSSAGEVILIGAADKVAFKFFSCTFSDTPLANGSRCSTESRPEDVTPPAAPQPGRAAPVAGNPRGRWADAFWFARQTYRVDAEDLPCRTVAPCLIGNNERWAPLSELRHAHAIHERIGVPYAQSTSSEGRPGPHAATVFPSAEDTERTPVPARRTADAREFVFGDIENSTIVRSRAVSVFGIDCSAFVSALWRLSRRLDTSGFIDAANRGSFERIAEIARVRMDDAFVINLENTLNHMVMFREMRRSGRFDSSLAVLVIESSSSCGGVCWSFYDESFFHGWAIIRRAAKPSPAYRPIPLTFAAWAELFVK